MRGGSLYISFSNGLLLIKWHLFKRILIRLGSDWHWWVVLCYKGVNLFSSLCAFFRRRRKDLNSLILDIKPLFFPIILLMDDREQWIIHSRLCSFYHQTETECRLEKDLLAQICLKHQPLGKHRLCLGSQSISPDHMPETVVDDAHMEESNDTEDSSEDRTVFIQVRMEQVTRELDVLFYTTNKRLKLIVNSGWQHDNKTAMCVFIL